MKAEKSGSNFSHLDLPCSYTMPTHSELKLVELSPRAVVAGLVVTGTLALTLAGGALGGLVWWHLGSEEREMEKVPPGGAVWRSMSEEGKKEWCHGKLWVLHFELGLGSWRRLTMSE